MAERFTQPETHPRLATGEVHVWRARIEGLRAAALARFAGTLAADEQTRAARFHFERDRNAYTAGRGRLRELLSRYSGTPAGAIRFHYGARGKPELVREPGVPAVEFNVSHRGEYALLAFTCDQVVGVDIEQLRDVPEAMAIARNHFTPAETRLLETAATRAELLETFFRLWTRKESVIKAVGTGLSLPLVEFDCSSAVTTGDAWHVVQVASLPGRDWALRDLQLGAGYRSALCVAGAGANVSFWDAD